MIWIRTQNGSQIIECRHIAIIQENGFFKIVSIVSDKDLSANKTYGVMLGTYSSYKNALNVMDDIQNYIDEENEHTFLMPEDDTVSKA